MGRCCPPDHERRLHTGPAKVFEREEDPMVVVPDGRIVAGDVVVSATRSRPAARGGPIGALQTADTITIDVFARRTDVDLSDEEIAARLADYRAQERAYRGAALTEYQRLVGSASRGAITH